MEAEITQFPHGRMTAAQFDAERTRLRGLYGDSRKEAGARYEQALARLFYQSGWTLNELAKREGKGKSPVSQLLIFGRFLWFLEEENRGKSDNVHHSGKILNPFLWGLLRSIFGAFGYGRKRSGSPAAMSASASATYCD